jgi:hypothetical protein
MKGSTMSLKFETPTRAKITSVNARSEMHGDKLVPAVDVKLEMDLPNADALSAYSTDLLDALYDRQAVSAQSSIPDISPVATHLRFPKLGPLKWKDATLHDALAIDYGLGGKSNVDLRNVKVHSHTMKLKEGGTVTVAFTCSAAGVSEQVVGRLGVRVGHEVHVVLGEGSPIEDSEDD